MAKSELFNEVRHEFAFDGTPCSFSIGKIARRSNSAVTAQMGDTIVLATVDVGDPMEGSDFFPMMVEYVERMYAGGLISSSRFVKRERFPSQGATLAARMIDRSIRSRFPSDYRNQVLIVLTVLSYDPKFDPVIIGFSAISAALMASSIPFEGPIAGVRVGYDGTDVKLHLEDVEMQNGVEGSEMSKALMNFVMGTDGKVVTMIDADSMEVSEDVIIKGMEHGVERASIFVEAQQEFIKKVEEVRGQIVKPEYTSFAVPKDLIGEIRKSKKKEIEEIFADQGRDDREDALEDIKVRLFKEYEGKYSKAQISDACDYVEKEIVRAWIIDEKKRTDGRKVDEIRSIDIEVGVLPRAHGSALFTRGGTQALTVITLGSSKLQLITEGMEGEETSNYMHHYNAPDYSVGEAGKYSYMPKRREIGHGSLAEKALIPVLPDPDVFPYTIRVVSEIMSQAGSSSMASVCGSTLSLMDAGVPIQKAVAGIAMGVVASEDLKSWVILTDIFDREDFYGDMDCKVAGTRDGITAIQMDNKRSGLPVQIFKEALDDAKKARLSILDQMDKVIDSPRKSLSKYAPKVQMVQIPSAKVGELIGPGGKVVKGIIEETGAEIDIHDDGKVMVSSVDDEKRAKAVSIIEEMFEEAEIGRVYKGKVDKIMDFGAFVDVSRSISGLVHVSEMSDTFVKDPRSIVKEGQEVEVIVTGRDEKGRLKLSMKKVPKAKKEE
jgi:polyribonucleotide nucleotidyltransferase